MNGTPIILHNPNRKGQLNATTDIIYPGNSMGSSCKASDPTRIRVDAAGSNIDFANGKGLEVQFNPVFDSMPPVSYLSSSG